ncbi:MAG: radical SAM protein [Bacteroidales bacterium]|nr:radical SAM protein [Bacteroidales bacterium]
MGKKYVLNPDYNYKNDIKRTLITYNSINQCETSSKGWFSIIHPIQAMLLSFFSTPTTLEQALENLSEFLDLSKLEAEKIISPYIENEEIIHTEYDGVVFSFPKKIIIEYSEKLKINYEYKPEDFVFQELDFETQRLFHCPSSITVMLTNQCVTNCLYCYADREKNIICSIPFSRIKEIISESKKLRIKNINLGGGEFFLYNRWYELLCELSNSGYDRNLISTKIPINENDIKKLKQFPNLTFQISFDLITKEKINQLLGVQKSYIDKMKHTLELMDKYELPYHVISVLTNLNSGKEELSEMYNYLSTLKRIKEWQVRIAYRSLYTSNEFEKIKLDKQSRDDAFIYLDELNKLNTLKIGIDKSYINRGFFTAEQGSKSFPGASCSANRSHIYILPDGNVTICEQMYWKNKFIIGNILENSIEEIWNSPAALKWVNFTKDDFRDESPCKNCELLDECYNKYPNKCWADVLKVYGDENWDYPDPRCKKAPAFINPII